MGEIRYGGGMARLVDDDPLRAVVAYMGEIWGDMGRYGGDVGEM